MMGAKQIYISNTIFTVYVLGIIWDMVKEVEFSPDIHIQLSLVRYPIDESLTHYTH